MSYIFVEWNREKSWISDIYLKSEMWIQKVGNENIQFLIRIQLSVLEHGEQEQKRADTETELNNCKMTKRTRGKKRETNLKELKLFSWIILQFHKLEFVGGNGVGERLKLREENSWKFLCWVFVFNTAKERDHELRWLFNFSVSINIKMKGMNRTFLVARCSLRCRAGKKMMTENAI